MTFRCLIVFICTSNKLRHLYLSVTSTLKCREDVDNNNNNAAAAVRPQQGWVRQNAAPTLQPGDPPPRPHPADTMKPWRHQSRPQEPSLARRPEGRLSWGGSIQTLCQHVGMNEPNSSGNAYGWICTLPDSHSHMSFIKATKQFVLI